MNSKIEDMKDKKRAVQEEVFESVRKDMLGVKGDAGVKVNKQDINVTYASIPPT